jgi:hypothetical protein
MSVLANNFKTKFAGLLRGLLRHVDSSEGAGAQAMPSALSPQPQPATQVPLAAMAPQPMDDPATYATAMSAPMAAPETDISEVEMPLLPILEKLPPDLRSKWMVGGTNLGAANVCISVEKILPQLAQGAVKITFGELRNAAPGLFRMGEEYDSLPIVLPLNDILARLNPMLLARNPGQRTVIAPPEIAGPFGSGAQGVSFANTLLKSTPPTTHFIKKPAAQPEPIKMQAPVPVTPPPPSFGQRTVTPAPSAPTLPIAHSFYQAGHPPGSCSDSTHSNSSPRRECTDSAYSSRPANSSSCGCSDYTYSDSSARCKWIGSAHSDHPASPNSPSCSGLSSPAGRPDGPRAARCTIRNLARNVAIGNCPVEFDDRAGSPAG